MRSSNANMFFYFANRTSSRMAKWANEVRPCSYFLYCFYHLIFLIDAIERANKIILRFQCTESAKRPKKQRAHRANARSARLSSLPLLLRFLQNERMIFNINYKIRLCQFELSKKQTTTVADKGNRDIK